MDGTHASLVSDIGDAAQVDIQGGDCVDILDIQGQRTLRQIAIDFINIPCRAYG